MTITSILESCDYIETNEGSARINLKENVQFVEDSGNSYLCTSWKNILKKAEETDEDLRKFIKSDAEKQVQIDKLKQIQPNEIINPKTGKVTTVHYTGDHDGISIDNLESQLNGYKQALKEVNEFYDKLQELLYGKSDLKAYVSRITMLEDLKKMLEKVQKQNENTIEYFIFDNTKFQKLFDEGYAIKGQRKEGSDQITISNKHEGSFIEQLLSYPTFKITEFNWWINNTYGQVLTLEGYQEIFKEIK